MLLPCLEIMPEARDYINKNPLARNHSDVAWSPFWPGKECDEASWA